MPFRWPSCFFAELQRLLSRHLLTFPRSVPPTGLLSAASFPLQGQQEDIPASPDTFVTLASASLQALPLGKGPGKQEMHGG